VEDLTMREHLRGHRPALAALLALLLLGADDKTDRDTEADLKEAATHMEAARWCDSRIALARAEGRLSRGGPKALRQRVEQMRKDIEMVQRLEAARFGRVNDKAGSAAHYAEMFRAYGLDVSNSKSEETSRQLKASALREQLLQALHAWAMLKPAGDDRKALLDLAAAADDNAWRKRLRQGIEEKDRKLLTALAGDAETARQVPAMLVLLARALRQANLSDEAIKVLRRGQSRYPDDFWLNFELGTLLTQQRAGRDEAVGFYRAALALRPQSPEIYLGLGTALLRQGKPEEAIRVLRQTLTLNPANAAAHLNLGAALAGLGKMDEAMACYRKALQLDPKFVSAYLNLAAALQQVGKFDESIACYRAAIALNPSYAEAHAGLGGVFAATGRIAESIACLRKAIELDPRSPSAHLRLGTTLARAGKLDEAIACYRESIRLDPKNAAAHFNLGHVLRNKGRLDEAIACYRRALELQPDLPAAKKALAEVMKLRAER
jgi:tetratricopeptide (TPR) repeat protein